MNDESSGKSAGDQEPAQPPPPPPVPPQNEAVLGEAEQNPSDNHVHVTVNLPTKTRAIEWLQLVANVALAIIGVFAICIYGGQLDIMHRQLDLSTTAQIPFIFLKDLPQSTEDLHDDSNVKWSEVWHNTGGSKPLELKIWSDCTDFLTTTPIKFHRRISPPINVVLGPHTDRTIGGCEASYNYLKKMIDENITRAHAGDETQHNFYIFGGADYRDFLGHPHTVEYCYQLYWDNLSLKFGFHPIQCLAPNDSHNCTDEECKDWSPAGTTAKKPN
jgi:hypothetical protein